MGVLDPAERVRFGAFELDLRSRELHKHGRRMKLQDHSFQLLALLLERPGELITREELTQRLWTAGTFVDFDAGLNTAIKRLRDVLADSAENPRFIETLPRQGYRFIAQVERIVPSSPPPTFPKQEVPPDIVQPSRTRPRLRHIWSVSLASAALLAIGLYAGHWRGWGLGSSRSEPVRAIAVLPLENLSGDQAQDYFVDGMTDALTTALAQIRAVRVISRTSMMRYKGTKKTVPQIAHELNIDAVVEGAIAQSAIVYGSLLS
jgi:DNA-binding winged helix-turn-helix (wHTH) protein